MATNNAINQIGVLPAFAAYNSADQADVSGEGTNYTVQFGTELYDVTSSYNIGTGIFTAPLAGKYCFTVSCCATTFGTSTSMQVLLITTGGNFYIEYLDDLASVTINVSQGSVTVPMLLGDTAFVKFKSSGGTKTIDLLGHATTGVVAPYFAGYMIAGI